MVTLLRELTNMGCMETEDDEFKPTICSGRGECGPNNSCVCEIRYTGDNCLDYNKIYHAGKRERRKWNRIYIYTSVRCTRRESWNYSTCRTLSHEWSLNFFQVEEWEEKNKVKYLWLWLIEGNVLVPLFDGLIMWKQSARDTVDENI